MRLRSGFEYFYQSPFAYSRWRSVWRRGFRVRSYREYQNSLSRLSLATQYRIKDYKDTIHAQIKKPSSGLRQMKVWAREAVARRFTPASQAEVTTHVSQGRAAPAPLPSDLGLPFRRFRVSFDLVSVTYYWKAPSTGLVGWLRSWRESTEEWLCVDLLPSRTVDVVGVPGDWHALPGRCWCRVCHPNPLTSCVTCDTLGPEMVRRYHGAEFSDRGPEPDLVTIAHLRVCDSVRAERYRERQARFQSRL